VPKKVNRIPGIKQLPEGKWQARLYHRGGEESRNFERREDAERWKRNLKSELDRCAEGVERTNKRWLATFIDATGVYSKAFNDVDSANKWLARAELSAEDGRAIDPVSSRTKFEDFASEWRKSKIDISGKTLATYNSQLKLHLMPEFRNENLVAITTSGIKKWIGRLSEKGIGATTIRQSYRLLHQVLQSALEDELIARNPAIGIKLPKIVSRKKLGLTREQLHALANSCGKYRPLVLFMGTCGLRINEALALRVQDFDIRNSVVSVKHSWTTDEFGKKPRDENGEFVPGSTKTNEERTVPVPAFLLEIIKPLLKGKRDRDWVFVGANGNALDYGYFRRSYLDPAVEKLGLKGVTSHSLRHTCASLLISLGTPITTVSYILGHASIKMTLDTYGHYYEDDTSIWMEKLGSHIHENRTINEKVLESEI
jgi:integrase